MSMAIRVERDVPLKMRDNVTLRADVYRPDDGDKHPAIVVRTPYNKIPSAKSDFLSPIEAAFAGYAMVIQDCRGRFASEGEYVTGGPEGQDGYDTVEAVAAEPWCDGNVGMVGASYLGRNQWQAALEAPPHLKAIAPHMITSGRLSDFRLKGVQELEGAVSWFAAMALDMIAKMARQGKDVSEMSAKVRYAMTHVEEACSFLPLKDLPYFDFEGLREGFLSRFSSDQDLAGLTSEKDLLWEYEKVTVPCLHSAGWYDLFVGGTLTNFLNMKERGGTELSRQSQHLIMGPWAHGVNLRNHVAGVNFGPSSSGPGSFVQNRHLAFFDKYLRGIESKYLVPVRYFVMGRNAWKSAETWPLPETAWQRFFLHSRGNANTAAGNGLLSRDEPGGQPPDIFVYNPMNPVPTRGGRNNPDQALVGGPLDQSLIESRSDVLCYTTPELKEEVEVTGPVVLHLFAATSAPDTDFMAKLVDVFPNGLAMNVAEGCIRARYRKSILKPEPVTPGEVYEYIIDLAATSNVFGRGHRIRIDVTSSNFPRFDRNMNTGHAFGKDAEGVPAMQTVFHQTGRASYVDLPVIPTKG